MKRSTSSLIIFFLISAFAIGPAYTRTGRDSAATPNSSAKKVPTDWRANHIEYFPGKLIVKLREGRGGATPAQLWGPWSADQPGLGKTAPVAERAVFPMAARQSGVLRGLAHIYELSLPESSDIPGLADELSRLPDIEYAEPRLVRRLHYVPNDSLYEFQSRYMNLMELAEAWDLNRGDPDVIIGIVDSGVDYEHPDLNADMWTNPKEVPGNGLDDDLNGYIDDVYGWDFGGDDPDPKNTSPNSYSSHGTNSAGVAAAVTDNKEGVAGMGFNCRLMAIKTTLDYEDDDRQLIRFGFEGIAYAALMGAKVINCSWGGSGASQFEKEIVATVIAGGSVIVASAGNENSDRPIFPAGYDGVMAVAATNRSDQRAVFGGSSASNYGEWVTVAAPGLNLHTTHHGGGYSLFDGTSAAAPVVSGLAGLVWSQHPDWTADQVREQIRVTGDNIDNKNPDFREKLGYGRVNAHLALTESRPSIRLVDVTVNDAGRFGNDNGVLDPGEQVRLGLKVVNFLAPVDNVSLTLEIDDPFIIMRDATEDLSTIGRLDTVDTGDMAFTLEIAANAPSGHPLDFTVRISDQSGAYTDRDHFSLTVLPIFADMNVGNLSLTVTNQGKLGFADFPQNFQGNGFIYGDDEFSVLFEGALLAGVGPAMLSDVARTNNDGQDDDFAFIQGADFSVITPGFMSDQYATALFDDSAAEFPLGLEILQESFAFADTANDDYVILKYTIKNTNEASSINGLYVGLFLDWDIGDEDVLQTNLVGFNHFLSLGYMYTHQHPTFAGAMVLSRPGATSHRAINNEASLFDDPGFTAEEKWEFLTGGFAVSEATKEDDNSHMISTGPFTLQPLEEVVVAFAVVGGVGLDALQAHAQAARAKWFAEFDTSGYRPPDPPSTFQVSDSYPNPFFQQTRIDYQLAKDSHVKVTVYNILGQAVRHLADAPQFIDFYSITWDGVDDAGHALSSGVYIIEVKSDGLTRRMKVALVR